MTEQERRRRRREMERRMRTRAQMRGREERKGGLTAFRVYVTAVLVGGCPRIEVRFPLVYLRTFEKARY